MKLRKQLRLIINEVFRADTRQGNLARRHNIRARSGMFDDEMLQSAAELDNTDNRRMADALTSGLTGYDEDDHVVYLKDYEELKDTNKKVYNKDEAIALQIANRIYLESVSKLKLDQIYDKDMFVGISINEGGYIIPVITGTIENPVSIMSLPDAYYNHKMSLYDIMDIAKMNYKDEIKVINADINSEVTDSFISVLEIYN